MRWTLELLHRPAFELLDTVPFFLMAGAEGGKLPHEAVKNWTVRGFLHPVMGKRGKRDVRRYTAADLLRIFLASRLSWQHTSVTASFLAAERAVERIEGFVRTGSFPIAPEDEHWVIFEDHGEMTSRYTGNDITNFWVQPSFIYNGAVYSPPIPRVDWSSSLCGVKTEVMNLDQEIKRFFDCFYRLDEAANLQSKMVFDVDEAPLNMDFEFDRYLAELQGKYKDQSRHG